MVKKTLANKEKLYKAILLLQTKEECGAFFDDICTIQELDALAQRLEVACALSEGESYIDINKQTGASTATICRVSRALNYGAGGYQSIIERLKTEDEQN